MARTTDQALRDCSFIHPRCIISCIVLCIHPSHHPFLCAFFLVSSWGGRNEEKECEVTIANDDVWKSTHVAISEELKSLQRENATQGERVMYATSQYATSVRATSLALDTQVVSRPNCFTTNAVKRRC